MKMRRVLPYQDVDVLLVMSSDLIRNKSRVKKVIFSCLFIFISFSICCQTDNVNKSNQTSNLIKEQKEIIGILSGEFKLKDGKRITSRWSNKEKTIARSYLKNLIVNIGLEAEEQKYVLPNVNPALDLLLSPFKGTNVYAILPSTTKNEEYVILGAHYDTGCRNCPGAIDDASGVTLAFSVFKRLSLLKRRDKNVVLVLFDQEEEDLVGSRAFAKYLKNEKFNVHSVHTFDMIGTDNDSNREMELELPTKELENVYRIHAKKFNIPIYTIDINSTDHHSFRELSFNAVGVNEAYGKSDTTPYKDTPKDTYDKVNFEYLASSTLFVLSVLTEIISN